VIRGGQFHRAFESPLSCPIDFEEVKGLLANREKTFLRRFKIIPVPSALSEVVVLEPQDWALFMDVGIRELFHSELITPWSDDIMVGRSAILDFLTRRPSKKMLNAVGFLKKKIALQHPYIGLQLRSMKDVEINHERFMRPSRQKLIWDCIRHLTSSGIRRRNLGNRSSIFFTTDEPLMYQVVKNELMDLGTVAMEAHPFEHTSRNGSLESVDILISIVEWYVLADAEVIICTGTSYCETAGMRANQRAEFFAIGPESYKSELWESCGGKSRFFSDNITLPFYNL
jgi:hypothetical protein